ncbi:MAG: hypothetical protein Q9222_000027 [Ikaeria aurantiellina]
MAVGLSRDDASPHLKRIAQQMGSNGLVVACVNSPGSVTISGDLDQIDTLHSELERQSIFAQKLHVSMAYHSPHMNLIADDYLAKLGQLDRGEPPVGPAIMISTVSGGSITSEQLLQAEYWVRNMVRPVNFEGALRKICGLSRQPLRKKLDLSHRSNVNVNDVLEVGPHAGLRGPIRECLLDFNHARTINYDSVLLRNQSAAGTLLKAIGHLHCRGYPVAISKANNSSSKGLSNLPDLPQYPFNHSQTYWHESRASKVYRFHTKPKMDLLGKRLTNRNPFQAEWRHFLRVSEQDWIGEHKVNGCLLFPASGMLVMAIEAIKQVAESNQDIAAFELRNVVFHTALWISSASEGTEVHIHLCPQASSQAGFIGWSDFRIYYRETEQWIETCRGSIKVVPPADGNHIHSRSTESGLEHQRKVLRAIKAQHTKYVDAVSLYRSFNEGGNNYGPTFQRLEDIKIGESNMAKATATLFRWHTHRYPQAHVIHPTSFDALSQLVLASLKDQRSGAIPARVVARIQRLWISNSGLSYPDASAVHAAASSVAKSNRLSECTVSVTDVEGAQLRLLMEGLQLTRVSSQEPRSAETDSPKQLCYQVDYKPDPDLLEIQRRETIFKACQLGRPEPIDFYRDLSLIILSFIAPLLEDMTQQRRENLAPHLSQYVGWLQLQYSLFCTGKLPHSSDSWHQRLRDRQHVESMRSQMEKTNSQGKMYVTVGRMLPQIISGEVDPLSLFFETDILKNAYQEINSDINCFPMLAKYLDLLSHKFPMMNIIELGAGTGGATQPILESLRAPTGTNNPRFRRYDFTDISESFFENAKASFSQYKRVNYIRCDIEQDPAEQGMDVGSYDLVIAANTGDFEDRFRNGTPLRLVGDILAQNGFSGADIVFRDYEDQTCHEQSAIVTTALPVCTDQQAYTNVNLLVDMESEFQQSIADHIKELTKDDAIRCKTCPLLSTVDDIDRKATVYIFLQELERPLLASLDHPAFKRIQKILTSSKGVLWVSKANNTAGKHPEYALIDGLSRAVRAEHDRSVFVTEALDTSSSSTSYLADRILGILRRTSFQSLDNSYEAEYVEVDNTLQIARLVEAPQLSCVRQALPSSSEVQAFQAGPPLEMRIGNVGLLDSIYFTQDETVDRPLAVNEVEIQVQTVGVNFKDCLVALGKTPETALGNECAGIIARVGGKSDFAPGDRVCAATKDCFRSFSRARSDFVWKIPDGLDITEAAALPATLVTAYIAIHYIAEMEPGESILIHAGAGGTGQAAIQIARQIHADIFVTVGTVEKKRWLMDEYNVPEDHIFYSRDTSFASGIRQMKKTGVDVVINSLAGESLVASWECIAPFGRFIEIGKQDILSDSSLPMSSFEQNVSFHALDVSLWMEKKPELVRRAMGHVLEMVADGRLHAARPLQEYSISDVEGAFRRLQKGDNMGKMVIRMDSTADVKARDADIATPACDITDREALRRTLDECMLTMPPIKGCIQASMVLKDSIFETMSYEDWKTSVDPKATGSWNLHEMLPQDLDLFILLSSVAGIAGLRGQSNYAAGNTFQDSLARYRTSRGQKTFALDLGAMISEGLLAENKTLRNRVLASGNLVPITQNVFFALLDRYCDPSLGIETLSACQPVIGINTPANIRSQGFEEESWLYKPLFGRLWQLDGTLEPSSSTTGQPQQSKDFKKDFLAAPDPSDAAVVVTEALVAKLSKSLTALEGGEVDLNRPMVSFGVDSLLAVELRSWLGKEFGADIPIFEIMGGTSFTAIGRVVTHKSPLRQMVERKYGRNEG